MKWANLRQFQGRRFQVVNTLTGKPISNQIGDIDEATIEMVDFKDAQGIRDDSVEVKEVK